MPQARLITEPMHRSAPIVVAALLVAVTFTGCATSGSTSADVSGQATSTSGANPAAEATESASTAGYASGQVQSPGAGTVNELVATASANAIELTPPVDLFASSSIGDGIDVSVSKLEQGRVEPQGPGELSGDALFVTVEVANESTEAVDLSSSFVTLEDADGVLAIPTSASPTQPLVGDLAPQQVAEGTYVFILPEAERRAVTITVSPIAGSPAAQFVGDARSTQGEQ